MIDRIPWTRVQIGLYLLGCLCFSIGVKFFIDSALGVDPLNSLVIAIVNVIRVPFIKVGFVSGAITLMFLGLWMWWNGKRPPITPFITMALVGYLIDFWNYCHVEEFTRRLFGPGSMLVTGLFMDSYASALIIMSGIGIRIMDLVAITIVHKWNWSFFSGKMVFEVGFISLGWLLGGPVGIGTAAFVCIVGPFIQPFMWANARYLGLPNYGLRREGAMATRVAPQSS